MWPRFHFAESGQTTSFLKPLVILKYEGSELFSNTHSRQETKTSEGADNIELTMFQAKNPETSTHHIITSELTQEQCLLWELWGSVRADWHWKRETKGSVEKEWSLASYSVLFMFSLGDCKREKKKGMC